MPELIAVSIGFLFVFTLVITRIEGGKKKKEHPVTAPICGCGHHYSFHSKSKKDCRATVYASWLARLIGDDGFCQCQQYTGPEPLPEYYAG